MGPETFQCYLFRVRYQYVIYLYPGATLSVCWSCSNITKRTNFFLDMLHEEISVCVGNIPSNVKILLLLLWFMLNCIFRTDELPLESAFNYSAW